MTDGRPATEDRYGEGFRQGVDWLYASGCISRADWVQLRVSLPLEVLSDRYARNEISREEFLRMRADLTEPSGGPE